MTSSPTAPTLGARYADEFPELALPWTAAEVAEPRLLVLNEPLAAELGLDPAALRGADGARFLVGNAVPDGARPVAQAYAGHQFGGYSPRLGDGRALLLGELTARGDEGRTGEESLPGLRDLHLKGSGRTPFARGGDGLAAVGPMLREFVVSEAMHALGIPTTRSLAVVATGTPVVRETMLPGAVLARVASSHLRVGTFQYARALAAGEDGDDDLLRRLADHAIARHHPHAAGADNPYLALFAAVLTAQAELVARWMHVGFVHGVMNTDNTTISGETIDYGPCAFMEEVDPRTVFSSIDTQGRYAYGAQPPVMQWNLARFAETLLPLVHENQEEAIRLLTAELETFPAHYTAAWTAGMRRKLGLGEEVDDEVARPLIDALAEKLAEHHPDHTLFFRRLTEVARGDTTDVEDGFGDWARRWRALSPDARVMERANPVYIPRNHLVEEALDAATAGDLGPFEELLVVVTDPYTERPGLERYARPAPPGGAPHVTYCGT
ncbi:protein adenylyltransferase SelO [Dietzia sp. 179-F 9C3 NHS]|uniref:protein adenylyltransferase SelO n=1 Tax=Dietzia sp. 179-F 9C3 NHS TaxID=3374295 RepID=UPI003878FE0D